MQNVEPLDHLPLWGLFLATVAIVYAAVFAPVQIASLGPRFFLCPLVERLLAVLLCKSEAA